MLFGNTRTNNRILSLAILIVGYCGCGNICSSSAQDVWNTTIQEATVKFVHQLRASVDATTRPCDDFHGYVCNKQRTTNQFILRPSEEAIFGQFIQNEDEDQLMDVELKLKRFHESCLNARGVEQLKSSHLYRITGGWPALEGNAAPNRRETPSWMTIVASFHDIGADYFFRHRIEIKSNKRYVQLEANLNLKYSLRKNIQLAEELLQSYGIEASEARMIALDFAGLEGYRREVAKTTGGRPITMSYSEFKSKFANIDWDVYFRQALGKPLKDSDGILLEDDQKLERVFDMLSKTPSSRLLNYVWIDYLLDKGVENCLVMVHEYFPTVYQYIVERSSIDKRRIAKMFSNIGNVYQSLLPESLWIDEISTAKSKLYLGKMIHMILNGDSKLDADYASLTMTKKNFYRNLEKCQRFGQDTSAVGRTVVATTSASLGDLYTFFMGPMYNETLPQPLWYGGVGEPFAEKMIDAGGYSSTAGGWRSNDSDEKYTELENCFQQQNASVPFSNLIGNNMVRRILAQRLSFEALQNWISSNGDMVNHIQGLLGSVGRDFTIEKLYFYTSVYTHCDEGKDFVNSYLKNVRAFSDTFGCPSGSNLKPARVCNVL